MVEGECGERSDPTLPRAPENQAQTIIAGEWTNEASTEVPISVVQIPSAS